jgi:hypothetical protein
MWMTVPSTDERLRRDLGRTVRPADPDELFNRLIDRRRRRATVRRLGAASLAVFVVAGTVGVFALVSGTFGRDVPADGAGGEIVFTHRGPDETTLSGATFDSIWVAESDGSDARPFVDAPDHQDAAATWSPDGTQVALWSSNFDPARASSVLNRELVVVNADGSGRRVIARSQDLQGMSPQIQWSPDGAQLAFLTLGLDEHVDLKALDEFGLPLPGVAIVNADGTGARSMLVSEGIYGLDWSSDGQALIVGRIENAFGGEENQGRAQTSIERLEIEDGTRSIIAELPSGSTATSLSVSPDGGTLAFLLGEAPLTFTYPATGLDSQVASMPVDGGTVTELTADGSLKQGLGWSPGGERLTYSVGGGEHGERCDIVGIGADGGAPETVIDGAAQGFCALSASIQPPTADGVAPPPFSPTPPPPSPEPANGAGSRAPSWLGTTTVPGVEGARCDVSSVRAPFPGLVAGGGPTAYLYSEATDEPCGPGTSMVLGIDLGRQDGVDLESGPIACPGSRCRILSAPDITSDQSPEVALTWDVGTGESPVAFYGFFDPGLGEKASIEPIGRDDVFSIGDGDGRRAIVTCVQVAHGNPPSVVQLVATVEDADAGTWTLQRQPWVVEGSSMTAGKVTEEVVFEDAIPAQGTLCGAPFGSPPSG